MAYGVTISVCSAQILSGHCVSSVLSSVPILTATAVRTSGKPGDAKGVSILLIPRSEGVKTKKMQMGGQWAAGTTWIDFEDVKVPVENLIGTEGEGFKIIMTNFNHVSDLCRRITV